MTFSYHYGYWFVLFLITDTNRVVSKETQTKSIKHVNEDTCLIVKIKLSFP